MKEKSHPNGNLVTTTVRKNVVCNNMLLQPMREKKPFKCESSDKTKGKVKKHIDLVHEGMKPLKCKLCDQNHCQNCNLQQHVGSVHEGKKPFKCETCDTTSSVKCDLKKHIPSDHKSKKLFKCESYLDDCAQTQGGEATNEKQNDGFSFRTMWMWVRTSGPGEE